MIRAAILSLALSGCAQLPYDPAVAECQRQSPPWLAPDCHARAKSKGRADA